MSITLGTVYRSSYTKDKKVYPILVMDIRTLSLRKEFNLTVNIAKWPSGAYGNGEVAQGKDGEPDYYIWTNFAKRGESRPSQIVGSIREVQGQKTRYKRGELVDPFMKDGAVYFNLFPIKEDRKVNEADIYEVMSS